jgi:hypothetical protein
LFYYKVIIFASKHLFITSSRVALLFSVFTLFLTACQKDTFKENQPPIVDAGRDTTIWLLSASNDTIALAGSATDADGHVVAYEWSQLSGPNAARILYPATASTKVGGVISGQYRFQLLAVDDKEGTGVKTVAVLIQAPEAHTLVLQPANNATEAYAYSYIPTVPQIGNTEIPIGSWTVNSTPVNYRAYLKMDYTVPANATINSAKLSLYAMPHPIGSNNVDAHFGTDNAFSIQRITSAWTASTTTWNSQPSATTTNQVVVPTSTSATQDAIDIDVTQLVKDMQQNDNYGFSMRLLTENYYNIRQYASSYNSDATKRPKLVIQYTN